MRLERIGVAAACALVVVATARGQGRPAAEGVPDERDWNRRPAGAVSPTWRDLAGLEAAAPNRRDLTAIAHAHQELGQLFAYDGRMERAIPEMEAAYRIVSKDPPADPAFRGARAYLEAVLGVLQLR